jgi:Domain of unknown function (DUF4410)
MLFLPLLLARIRFTARILLTPVFLAIVALQPADAGPQAADAPPNAVPVFVSDFELYSVLPPPNSPKPQAALQNKQTPKTLPASGDPELPSVQARRLMDFFATTVVDTLRKSGYTARRARGATPPKGALLRGVFAEADEKNRIRRALLGGTSANPKFFLYVGIFNLARPDQPLYQLAPEQEQSAGSQFGPVITLNSYIPLAKYELDKNPSEEDIRKICAQIAASLTSLMAANPAAFSE